EIAVKTKSVKPLKTLNRYIGEKCRVWSVEGHGTRLAFSLIEIMVTIALLSFIVLGLLAMFNQTQKAFRSSMTQVDVLESGRAVTDMIARDVEQMVPGQLAYFTDNNNQPFISTNFFAELS